MKKQEYSFEDLLKLKDLNSLVGHEFALMSKNNRRPLPHYSGVITDAVLENLNVFRFKFLMPDGSKYTFYINDDWLLEII